MNTNNDAIDSDARDEIKRLLQLQWFPSVLTEEPQADQAETPCASVVMQVQATGAKARMDESPTNRDAVLRLYTYSAACLIQMLLLVQKRPHFAQMAFARSLCFPAIESPVGSITSAVRLITRAVKAGRLLFELSSAKVNLGRTVNICAFQLFAFMVLARRGFVTINSAQRWVADCSALPRLSCDSVAEWWRVGKCITKEMFPDLDALLFGANAGSPKHYYADAVVELRRAFERMWTVFLLVEAP